MCVEFPLGNRVYSGEKREGWVARILACSTDCLSFVAWSECIINRIRISRDFLSSSASGGIELVFGMLTCYSVERSIWRKFVEIS